MNEDDRRYKGWEVDEEEREEERLEKYEREDEEKKLMMQPGLP